MVKKVKKLFGTNPEKVVVLTESVQFNEEGIAEVTYDVADVLKCIPGYYVITEEENTTSEDNTSNEDNTSDEDNSEEQAEKVVAPKKPAPRKPSPKKA